MVIALILAVAVLWQGVIWMLPRLVAFVAMGFALGLAWAARKTSSVMLAARTSDLDYDQTPARATRRAMRASLRTAIKQTELRSLFPSTIAQADAWARWSDEGAAVTV